MVIFEPVDIYQQKGTKRVGGMSNNKIRWFLVSNCGMNFPLHQTMISLGKEGCDVVLQSRSVDKRHALITYDHYEKRFKVKDLNSINGTYLNEVRIPSQTFIKLEHLDSLRFGFDVVVYQIQQVVEEFPVPVIPDYRFGVWQVRPYPQQHSMKMADCQGCLQKQAIRHTCGLKGPDLESNQSRVSGQHQTSDCIHSENTYPNASHTHQGQTSVVGQDYCGNIVPQANPAWGMMPPQSNPASRGIPTMGSNGVENNPQQSHLHGQPHLVSQNPCTCSYQNHIPGASQMCAVTHPTSQTKSSPAVNSLPNKSLTPASNNTSLQSTYSGDSLDLTLDDNAKQQQKYSNSSESKDEQSLRENVENAGKNVVAAEKPYTSSEPAAAAALIDSATGKAGCMAFTIEFDDGEPSLTKKLDIKDSISKFAPPKPESEHKIGHRRNLSLTKVLDSFSDENGNCKGKRSNSPVEGARCGHRDGDEALSPTMAVMSAAKDKLIKPGILKKGYHSDGHASSDDECADLSAKSDPDKRTLKHKKDNFEVVGLPMKLSLRNCNCSPPKSNSAGRRSLPATGLRDSAKYLINKMFGEISAPTNSPTEPISPTVLLALNADKAKRRSGILKNSPSQGRVLPLTKNDGKSGSHGSLNSCMTYTVDTPEKKLRRGKGSRDNDEQVKEIIFSDEEDECEDNEDLPDEKLDDGIIGGDNLSEAGTYTIESDQKDSKEEMDARKNIDNVFGVTGDWTTIERPVVDAEDDHQNVELRQKNSDLGGARRSSCQKAALRKGTPGWLKEWVVMTATDKNNKATSNKISEFKSDEANMEISAHNESQSSVLPDKQPPVTIGEKAGTRQRRKLPVPPVDRVPSGLASAPVSGNAGTPQHVVTASTKTSSSSSASPDGRRSDSSVDTETILKETENVMSAMQARMDHQQHNTSAQFLCQESRDSGGESDVDTSTASGANDAEGRFAPHVLNKKLTAQLALQLKALEIDNGCGRSNNRSYGRNPGSHGRSTPSGNYSEVETASIHSDMSSSSDVSGSSPASNRKGSGEKAPLMRFNRAFSLRRARLGCEPEGQGRQSLSAPKPSASVAPSRPSSASSVGSSKDRQRRGSASNKSDSGCSAVSTPAASAHQNASGGSFDRSDGGRFSLRLPRSAPPGRTLAKSSNGRSSAGRTKAVAANTPSANPNPRCNSTLSAKELEMKNWKRRKEYDPLKAAAEGRKKDVAKKSNPVALLSKSESHSPTSTSFTRSASFHGTDELGHLRSKTFLSDDVDSIPEAVQLGRSIPTDAFGLINSDGKYRTRKSSEDECASEATRAYSHTDLTSVLASSSSPRGSPLLHPVHRHKSKIDALDNLVISTVHQVSCNLRGNAKEILKRLGDVHGKECSTSLGAGGLVDLLERIGNIDSPELSPPGTTSISRQLSGILKNMKCLEESMQVINKVLDVVEFNPVENRCPAKVNGNMRKGDGVMKIHGKTYKKPKDVYVAADDK